MSAADPTAPNDPISQRAAFWFGMLKYFGWPGVILIALALGARSVVIWSAPKVDAVVQAHITVVTGLLEQSKLQNENQTRSNQILDQIKENQRAYGVSLEKHGELLNDIHRAVVPPKEKP